MGKRIRGGCRVEHERGWGEGGKEGDKWGYGEEKEVGDGVGMKGI